MSLDLSCPLVIRLVGWSVFHNFRKGQEVRLPHSSVGELVFNSVVGHTVETKEYSVVLGNEEDEKQTKGSGNPLCKSLKHILFLKYGINLRKKLDISLEDIQHFSQLLGLVATHDSKQVLHSLQLVILQSTVD